MRESNELLRQARVRVASPHATGSPLSRTELAELITTWVRKNRDRDVAVDDIYIGKLERGEIRWPGSDYRAALRSVLKADTDAALGFRSTRQSRATVKPVDRKDFLRAALGTALGAATGALTAPLAELLTDRDPPPVPGTVGRGEVEQVRAAATMFGNADASHGGDLVRIAVQAQLRHCARLLNAQCAARWRPDLISAVGDLADVAAFMHFDAHAHDDARAMFGFALGCAEEANDWHLRAKVLSNLARQASHCGDPDTGLTLIEYGMVRADRLTGTERASLLIGRARALAKLGRREDTLTAVGMADEEFVNAATDTDVPWMAYYDQPQHAGDTGHALAELALRGHGTAETTIRLQTAVAGHTSGYIRSRLFSQVKLATVIMTTGDPRHAAEIGAGALVDAPTVRSSRLTEDLRRLRHLATRHTTIPEVAELRTGLGRALAAT